MGFSQKHKPLHGPGEICLPVCLGLSPCQSSSWLRTVHSQLTVILCMTCPKDKDKYDQDGNDSSINTLSIFYSNSHRVNNDTESQADLTRPCQSEGSKKVVGKWLLRQFAIQSTHKPETNKLVLDQVLEQRDNSNDSLSRTNYSVNDGTWCWFSNYV